METMNEQYMIHLHHIGGRDATVGGLEIPVQLQRFFKVFLYDADENAVSRERYADQWKDKWHVLPYFLGDQANTISFNIATDPNMSSSKLMLDNPPILAVMGFEYDTKVCGAPKKSIEVNCKRLDDVLADIGVPCDFLSVDAESTNFEVVEGALNALKNSILFAVIEAQFNPTRIAEKCMGEIIGIMHNNDFSMLQYVPHPIPISYCSPRIGLRGISDNFIGDCFFIKNMSALENNSLKLLKLSIICLVHGKLDYAVNALSAASACGSDDKNLSEHFQLIIDFYNLVKRTPAFPLIKFDFVQDDINHFRFPYTARLRDPNFIATLRHKYFSSIDASSLRSLPEQLPILTSREYTELERYVESELGLGVLARTMADTRIIDIIRLLDLLGFVERSPGMIKVDSIGIGKVVEQHIEGRG
jgi:FkbM family methyltransferase